MTPTDKLLRSLAFIVQRICHDEGAMHEAAEVARLLREWDESRGRNDA